MPRTPLEVSPAFDAGSPRPHFKTRSAGPGLSMEILGNAIFRFVNKINELQLKELMVVGFSIILKIKKIVIFMYVEQVAEGM